MNVKNDISTNVKQTLWTKNFICITLSTLLLYFGFEMLMTTLPLYIKQIGGSDSAVGISVGLFTVTALILRAAAGVLLDRYGRRGIFFIGLIAMAAVTFSYSFVTTVAMIMAIRILHGMSWGVANTAAGTIASDNIPKSRFGEGMGYFGLASSIAMAVGPATGLMVLADHSFPALFNLAALIMLAALLLAFFVSYRRIKAPALPPGCVNAENPANAADSDDAASTVNADAAGCADAADFADMPETPHENAKKSGDKNGRISFLERTALIPSVSILFVCATYGALIGFLALFAEQEGIANIGVYFAVYAVAMLITRPIAGKLTDRHGFSAVVYPGFVLTFLGLLILAGSHSFVQFMISAAFYGVGIGSVQCSLQSMAVVNAAADRVGTANATFFIGFDTGIGIGSVAAGIVASSFGYGAMYGSFSIFIVAAAVFYFIACRVSKKRNVGETRDKRAIK